jgi:heme oxygenase
LQTVPPPTLLLLHALREGTQDLHERIESRLDIPARLTTPDAYRTLLERFFGYYSPLEDILAAPERAADRAALGLDLGDRRKAGLLESDLRDLGLSVSDVAGLARCPAGLLPSPRGAAALAGCAYVLEGATLGGQVIGRHLDRALGRHPGGPGARFFHGYGARTGAMWQRFRQTAEALLAREETNRPGSGGPITDQAVAAARQTFIGMEDWVAPEDACAPAERQQ